MSFSIAGLDPHPFRHLVGLPDEQLARFGARRQIADREPGFPDRVELRDARVGEVPVQLRTRLLSLRGFDADDMLVDADVVDGARIEPLINQLFAHPSVAYVHAHFARPGCFACRIDRAE